MDLSKTLEFNSQKNSTLEKIEKKTMKSRGSGTTRKNKTKTALAKHCARKLKSNMKRETIHVDEALFSKNPELLKEIKEYNISVHDLLNDLNKY